MSLRETLSRPDWLFALTILLVSCGEDGDRSRQALVSATPGAPATPTPTPTPVPTPVPTPSPTPTGPPIASVAPGGRLEGPLACAQGNLRYSTESDGSSRLTDVSAITSVNIADNYQRVDYPAVDMFQLDLNCFGGPWFSATNRRAAPSRAYDYFRVDADEFEVYRNATRDKFEYATIGRASSLELICFYAAGSRGTTFPINNGYSFYGIADGLLVRNGSARRLFGSAVTGSIDGAKREVQISIELASRDVPFGEFLDVPSIVAGTATARFTYAGTGFAVATLTGPDGSTGTITGQFYEDWLGLGFVFELRYPNGDRMFGAVAADLNQI